VILINKSWNFIAIFIIALGIICKKDAAIKKL
jgi:hypothetical protein